MKRIPRCSQKQDPKGKRKEKAVIDDEDSRVLKSQEGYFGDKELNAKLQRSTGVYIPGERDSPT